MKLSEFKDEKGIEVVANLLTPLSNIVRNPETASARNKGVMEFVAAMLRNSPGEVKTMLAILADEDPAQYHCSAASVLADALNMLNDPELLQLFGLQSETAASSGSASETTEAQNTQPPFSVM